jgi:hypothetical protein
MKVFDFLFQNNFGVHFIWTLGFIAWILSSCFWVLKIDIVSLILVSISIIFCIVAIISTSDVKLKNQEKLQSDGFGFSIYFLITSFSVIIMILSNSLATGLTANIFFFVLFYSLKTKNWKK